MIAAIFVIVVWLFYGLGGSATSPGIDQIATQLKASGVTIKGPYGFEQAATVAADIRSSPGIKVLVGYSCGVGATAEAANESKVPIALVAGIQGSKFCPPPPLMPNVRRAIEVYNPNCAATFSLGCAVYTAAPPFPSRIRLIANSDSHGYADINPATQRIIVQAVRSVR